MSQSLHPSRPRAASVFASVLPVALALALALAAPGCTIRAHPPGGGTSETDCADGVDDDGDGATDCADDDCAPACFAFCGDSVCSEAAGEDCAGCAIDCGTCPFVCGDGFCAPGEDCAGCSADCSCVCGDGACTGKETCATCVDDCGECCGDGS